MLEGYLLNGARSAALKTYQACREMLASEFGMEPSPATQKLAAQIEKLNQHTPQTNALEQSTNQLTTLPFIGRTVEHQRLVAAFRQLGVDGLSVTAVVGEAGIGKTRLIEDFLSWLSIQPDDVDLLTCRAFEMGGKLPYQPIVQALRERLDRENAPDDLLADVWLAELGRVLPELLERYPDLELPKIGDADIARSRLFEAVAMLGIALADRRPTVIFLDDLQWVDEATLELLHYVANRWQTTGSPIMLLLTVRQEGLAERVGITDWFYELGKNGRFSRITVTQLNPLDVTNLIQAITQEPRTIEAEAQQIETFAQWLHHETGGSPFFLEAFLRLLIEQDVLIQTRSDSDAQAQRGRLDINRALKYVHKEDQLALPPTVRDVIVSRLEKLDKTASELLIAASILGRQATFERFCQIAGVDELEGIESLEKLLNQRLLIEVGGKRPYRFAHDNIRETVYGHIGTARRRLYHRRAFAGLETDGGSAAELLFHAQAAQLQAETFPWAVVAGQEAAQAFGYDEAISHYDVAWQMVQVAGFEVEGESLLVLCREYGRSLEANTDFAAANTFFEEVKQLAQRKNSNALKLIGIMGQATLRGLPTALQNSQMAETLATEAVALAKTLNDYAAEAKGLWLLQLRHAFARKQFDLAIQYGEASLAIARKHRLQWQLSYTLHDLVPLYREQERVADANTAEAEAQILFQELNNLPLLSDSFNTKSYWLSGGESKYDEAFAFASKGLELSRSIGNLYNQYSALLAMGVIHFERGEMGSAIERCQETLPILRNLQAGQIYEPLGWLAMIYGELGMAEKVRPMQQRILENFNDIPEWTLIRATSHAVYGLTLIGDLDKAEKLLQKIEALYTPEMSIFATVPVTRARVTLYLQLGRPDDALQFLKQYLPNMQKPNTRVWGLPELYFLQGKAYLAKEKFKEGMQVLKMAHALSIEMKEMRLRWRILATLADLEEKLGGEAATSTGSAQAVSSLRQEARAALQTIINQIPEGELRASFVALPAVEKLLS